MEIAQILATHDIKDEGDIKLDSRLLYQYMKERRSSWKREYFTYAKFHGTVREYFAPWENPDIEERFDDTVTDKRTTNAYFIVGHDESMAFLAHHYGDVMEAWAMEVKRIRKDLRDAKKKLITMESALVAAKETWAKNQANALRVTALVRMLVNDGKLDMSEKTLAENFKSGIKYDVDWARDMYERYGKKYDGKQNATAFIYQCLSEEFTATVAPRIELVAEHQTKYQPLKLRSANQAP